MFSNFTQSGMNMAGTSGCNSTGSVPGNGFSGCMRAGASGHFPTSGQSLGSSNNACQPGVPGTPTSSVSGGDVCCGNGQSPGPSPQQLSGGINSQMGGYQGCSSNGMTGMRPGMHGNNFMPNGSFQNDYITSHGQVGILKSNLKCCIKTFIYEVNVSTNVCQK